MVRRGHRASRWRTRYGLPLVVMVLTGALAAGCAGASPPSPSPARGAATFDEFADGFCSAFESLFRAVGNPDTAAWSQPTLDLQAAAERRDAAAAERLAAQITAELETGRARAAFVAGWRPGSAAASQLDRFLLASEAWVDAYVDVAREGPTAVDPQQAFEQAGGLDAWRAVFEAMRPVASARPPGEEHQCPNVPLSL